MLNIIKRHIGEENIREEVRRIHPAVLIATYDEDISFLDDYSYKMGKTLLKYSRTRDESEELRRGTISEDELFQKYHKLYEKLDKKGRLYNDDDFVFNFYDGVRNFYVKKNIETFIEKLRGIYFPEDNKYTAREFVVLLDHLGVSNNVDVPGLPSVPVDMLLEQMSFNSVQKIIDFQLNNV